MQIEETIATSGIDERISINATGTQSLSIEYNRVVATDSEEGIFFGGIIDCQMQNQEAIAAIWVYKSITIDACSIQSLSIKYYRLIFTNGSKTIFTGSIVDG